MVFVSKYCGNEECHSRQEIDTKWGAGTALEHPLTTPIPHAQDYIILEGVFKNEGVNQHWGFHIFHKILFEIM